MNNTAYYKKRPHSLNELCLFALFGIFTVFSLLIVVLGAKVFQTVSDVTDTNNEVRSSLFYMANKIRSADEENGIQIREKNGVSILVLGGDENDYETMIYYYDGSIRELLNKKDAQFDLNLGESIIKTNDFTIEKNGQLIFLSVTAGDGEQYSIHIYLQSRQ